MNGICSTKTPPKRLWLDVRAFVHLETAVLKRVCMDAETLCLYLGIRALKHITIAVPKPPYLHVFARRHNQGAVLCLCLHLLGDRNIGVP